MSAASKVPPSLENNLDQAVLIFDSPPRIEISNSFALSAVGANFLI